MDCIHFNQIKKKQGEEVAYNVCYLSGNNDHVICFGRPHNESRLLRIDEFNFADDDEIPSYYLSLCEHCTDEANYGTLFKCVYCEMAENARIYLENPHKDDEDIYGFDDFYELDNNPFGFNDW